MSTTGREKGERSRIAPSSVCCSLTSVKRCSGMAEWRPHICTTLSFPPDASSRSSGDHLIPHTSLRCPTSVAVAASGARTSRSPIDWSTDPDARTCDDQDSAPTLPLCACSHVRVATVPARSGSQTDTCPELVPTARYVPRCREVRTTHKLGEYNLARASHNRAPCCDRAASVGAERGLQHAPASTPRSTRGCWCR